MQNSSEIYNHEKNHSIKSNFFLELCEIQKNNPIYIKLIFKIILNGFFQDCKFHLNFAQF
jgi:hypothetical protein